MGEYNMKKAKHIILSAILITICLFNLNIQAETEILYGDTNGDGIVSAQDATAIQRYIADLDELDYESQVRADVDGDGKLTANDAKLIQKCIVKIIDLPVKMGDVNEDGVVDATDAELVLKYAV